MKNKKKQTKTKKNRLQDIVSIWSHVNDQTDVLYVLYIAGLSGV